MWFPFILPLNCHLITFRWVVFLLPLVLYNVYHTRKAAKEFFKDCQNSVEMKERFFFFFLRKGISMILHAQTKGKLELHVITLANLLWIF